MLRTVYTGVPVDSEAIVSIDMMLPAVYWLMGSPLWSLRVDVSVGLGDQTPPDELPARTHLWRQSKTDQG